MSEKNYLSILKVGIFFSLLSSLLVFKNLLFPYISGKQIYFNILIEILAVFWLAFIIKYPKWNPFKNAHGRPKRFLISYGLIAYFFFILLSCFTGVDFNLSFWGDIERMLGFFHIIHFLILYFIIITVMRTWQDWKMLFLSSIIIASIVALYGLIVGNPQTTLGNAAYVAAFMIFNFYFTFILFAREKSFLKWFYILPAIIIMMSFMKASIAGAIVGLGFSFLVLLILYSFLGKGKKIKILASVTLLVILFLIAGFVMVKDSDFVRGNSWLRPFTEVNLEKNTFQTRLISWRGAIEGFDENPILGTGWGNYAIVFDKYFDPVFYDYTQTETFFDRAHNNLIEILATVGLAGLAAYLFVCVAIFYYLVLGYLKKKIKIHDFILVSCLVVAYFVQNLALFDALVTYIALMMTIGYVYWLQTDPLEREDEENGNIWHSLAIVGFSFIAVALLPTGSRSFFIAMLILALAYWIIILIFFINQKGLKFKRVSFSNNEKAILLFIGLIAIAMIWQFNLKPYKMMAKTIESQAAFQSGDILKSYELAKESFAYDTVLDRDARVAYIKKIANVGNISFVKNKYPEQAEDIFSYAVELAEKNIAYNKNDCLNQQFLAQALMTLATFHSDDQEKFYYYTKRALEAIDQAVITSPERPTVYYTKARLHVLRGEKEEAIATSEYAAELNSDYFGGYCSLAQVYSSFGQEAESLENMNKCIDLGGLKSAQSTDFLDLLIDYYMQQEDDARLLKIFQRYAQLNPKNVNVWTGLANLYGKLGEKDKAIEAAHRAAEIDPSLESVAEDFISELEK